MTNSGKAHCVLRTPVKPNWIHTILWGVVAAIVGFKSVACLKCTSSDLMNVQKPCRAENNELVRHIGSNHSSKLCDALHELWFCVAKNEPRCFHNVTFIHQSFTHSPHNCRMSNDYFLKIQKIIRENEENGDTSPTPTPTPTTTSSTGNDGADPGYTIGHKGGGPSGGGPAVKSCDHVTYLLLSLLILVHTRPVL